MTRRRRLRSTSVAIALAFAFLGSGAQAENDNKYANACFVTAVYLNRACELDAIEEAKIGRAKCVNATDRAAARRCQAEVDETRNEAKRTCVEQFEARDDVCDALPKRPYDPTIDPENFVAEITNPYAPFSVGSRWVYEKDGEDGLERIVVEVLAATREILGVECTSVSDKVYRDGVLIEDTIDWLAQDAAGNVWYFGELSQNFEEGRLANLDGSFVAGVDGAKPGFWMKAAPRVGETYRQEWALGEAEDMASIVSLDADVEVPFDNDMPILQVQEFTPISPGALEYKYFVPGVGFVLEVDPASDERLELIEYTPG